MKVFVEITEIVSNLMSTGLVFLRCIAEEKILSKEKKLSEMRIREIFLHGFSHVRLFLRCVLKMDHHCPWYVETQRK